LEGTQETYTLAHEENVRFVSEAWQQVERQLGGGPAGESGPRPVQYVEKTPNPRLQRTAPLRGPNEPHGGPLPGEDHGGPCPTLSPARRRPHLKCQHLDFCTC
uniref:MAPK regulated corepressor interacting protein 2 n=1 Tax=Panthera tigris altaica TaxID=74533 RepID=A0A8C9MBD6_PANTA